MPAKPTVLIVDDDREIVRGLSIRLNALGYQVFSASDGPSGLACASERRPDAILLDIRMPGMDGFEVLGHLKQKLATAAIPVVVLSANVVEQTRHRAMTLGASYFMAKPFTAERLFAALQKTLGSATCQASP